ncbi:unnamed protein product [Caenorhabditis sp. 36 PRJEB53466]|nr:unnamed protein product [Caenorhabditis sp. 36 PRJEB53466]
MAIWESLPTEMVTTIANFADFRSKLALGATTLANYMAVEKSKLDIVEVDIYIFQVRHKLSIKLADGSRFKIHACSVAYGTGVSGYTKLVEYLHRALKRGSGPISKFIFKGEPNGAYTEIFSHPRIKFCSEVRLQCNVSDTVVNKWLCHFPANQIKKMQLLMLRGMIPLFPQFFYLRYLKLSLCDVDLKDFVNSPMLESFYITDCRVRSLSQFFKSWANATNGEMENLKFFVIDYFSNWHLLKEDLQEFIREVPVLTKTCGYTERFLIRRLKDKAVADLLFTASANKLRFQFEPNRYVPIHCWSMYERTDIVPLWGEQRPFYIPEETEEWNEKNEE